MSIGIKSTQVHFFHVKVICDIDIDSLSIPIDVNGYSEKCCTYTSFNEIAIKLSIG